MNTMPKCHHGCTQKSFGRHRESGCIPLMFAHVSGFGGGKGLTSLAAATLSSSCPRRIVMPSFISAFPFLAIAFHDSFQELLICLAVPPRISGNGRIPASA